MSKIVSEYAQEIPQSQGGFDLSFGTRIQDGKFIFNVFKTFIIK